VERDGPDEQHEAAPAGGPLGSAQRRGRLRVVAVDSHRDGIAQMRVLHGRHLKFVHDGLGAIVGMSSRSTGEGSGDRRSGSRRSPIRSLKLFACCSCCSRRVLFQSIQLRISTAHVLVQVWWIGRSSGETAGWLIGWREARSRRGGDGSGRLIWLISAWNWRLIIFCSLRPMQVVIDFGHGGRLSSSSSLPFVRLCLWHASVCQRDERGSCDQPDGRRHPSMRAVESAALRLLHGGGQQSPIRSGQHHAAREPERAVQQATLLAPGQRGGHEEDAGRARCSRRPCSQRGQEGHQ